MATKNKLALVGSKNTPEWMNPTVAPLVLVAEAKKGAKAIEKRRAIVDFARTQNVEIDAAALEMQQDNPDTIPMVEWAADQLCDRGFEVDIKNGRVFTKKSTDVAVEPASAVIKVAADGVTLDPKGAAEVVLDPFDAAMLTPAVIVDKKKVERGPWSSPYTLQTVFDLTKRDGGDDAKAVAAMRAAVASWPPSERRAGVKRTIAQFNGPSAKSPFGLGLRAMLDEMPAIATSSGASAPRVGRRSDTVNLRGRIDHAYLNPYLHHRIADGTVKLGEAFTMVEGVDADGHYVVTLRTVRKVK